MKGRRCNLDCLWCHGDFFETTEGSYAISNQQIASAVDLIAEASQVSQAEVAISGNGDPTLAGEDELCDLIGRLRGIEAVSKIKLVTNGVLLAGMTRSLVASGLDAVNITVNSLDRDTYAFITGKDTLLQALGGVNACLDTGVVVKLNVIYCRLNDRDIDSFIRFSSHHGVTVKIFDLLITRPLCKRLYLPLDRLRQKLDAQAVSTRTYAFPYSYREYELENGAKIQLKTASQNNTCPNLDCPSRHLCLEGCRSSVRLSEDGTLHPCGVRKDNTVRTGPDIVTLAQLRKALISGGKITP